MTLRHSQSRKHFAKGGCLPPRRTNNCPKDSNSAFIGRRWVCATDVAPVLLFKFHRFPANRLTNSNLSLILSGEESHYGAVKPCMKAKHLLGLGVVIAVTGFAASAQAGTSFGISIGIPAYVQTAPYCSPPVVYCPPPVSYYRSPVVYVAPRCGPYYGHRELRDYREYRGHKGDHRHSGHNSRGYNRGGHR